MFISLPAAHTQFVILEMVFSHDVSQFCPFSQKKQYWPLCKELQNGIAFILRFCNRFTVLLNLCIHLPSFALIFLAEENEIPCVYKLLI